MQDVGTSAVLLRLSGGSLGLVTGLRHNEAGYDIHVEVHGAKDTLAIGIDTRTSPGYSRRGTLLRGTLHDYRDQNDGPYSFQRLDGTAEQYVPILQGNWVFYLGLHASTTSTPAAPPLAWTFAKAA